MPPEIKADALLQLNRDQMCGIINMGIKIDLHRTDSENANAVQLVYWNFNYPLIPTIYKYCLPNPYLFIQTHLSNELIKYFMEILNFHLHI